MQFGVNGSNQKLDLKVRSGEWKMEVVLHTRLRHRVCVFHARVLFCAQVLMWGNISLFMCMISESRSAW